MSETKFTPGPWFRIGAYQDYVQIGGSNSGTVNQENAHRIIGVYAFPHADENKRKEEAAANAALIAAAPDMYAALNTALDHLCDRETISLGKAVDIIEAALDKAAGKR